jgi:MOSC domain-containing protein YiiM
VAALTEPLLRLEVTGLFVGRPAVIGTNHKGPVLSSIARRPVSAASVHLGPLGFDGDAVADPSVHGGVDAAVYVYPTGHYADWAADGFDLAEVRVGENVRVAGAVETDVHVGDTWRWGGAVVQITKPRFPCYKFGIHAGRNAVVKHMTRTGWCGWYLRVLEPGEVPVGAPMEQLSRAGDNPTIAEVFAERTAR